MKRLPERIIEELKDSIIYAADGGAEPLLKAGITPEVLIGDNDSINSATLETLKLAGTHIITHPRDKDKTDSELAVERALEERPEEIILVSSLQGRPDHSLANLYLLRLAMMKGIDMRLVGNGVCAFFVDREHPLEKRVEIGCTVSILPLTGAVSGVCTKGLKWEMEGGELYPGSTRGISNVSIDEKIRVSVESGGLLTMILAREGYAKMGPTED